jgi:hypothetical protein
LAKAARTAKKINKGRFTQRNQSLEAGNKFAFT